MRDAANMQRLVSIQGGPDDLAVIGDTVYVSLIKAGKVVAISPGGRITEVATGLAGNEGIVDAGDDAIYVVEQAKNRIDRIAGGQATPIKTFQNRTGKAGIDGIHAGPGGLILVPDSPNGTLLELNPQSGGVRVLASGLGRPVDAVAYQGGYAVADEIASLVLIPAAGSPRSSFTTMSQVGSADDVGVTGAGDLLVTSLNLHALFRYRAGSVSEVAHGFLLTQGLAMRPDGSWLVSDEDAGVVRVLPGACV